MDKKIKICTILGARPQFIKAAVVSRALLAKGSIEEVIIHTGQHYDHGMSDVFFEELGIPAPRYNLGIGSGPHGQQTGQMLGEIEKVLLAEKPDWVLVYGDTNSTLAGAIAATKLHIPLAHVEAGLRSSNRYMPEEINRIATDSISTILFAPTQTAVNQLKHEGQPEEKIVFTGDVMYDLLLETVENAKSESRIVVDQALEPENYFLVTFHRAENTDDETRLQAIAEALCVTAKTRKVVFPVHPRTRVALQKSGLWESLAANVALLDPVGYADMVELIGNAAAIVTDSGGLQKEAFFQKKVCYTLRDETEWTELVDSGWNRLVPVGSPQKMANEFLNDTAFARRNVEPYGDGRASEIIAESLARKIKFC